MYKLIKFHMEGSIFLLVRIKFVMLNETNLKV